MDGPAIIRQNQSREHYNSKPARGSPKLTPLEFRDAVSKGLGRAIVALRAGEIAPSLSFLRPLVFRWQGQYGFYESSRGEYCADLIEASAYAETLKAELKVLLSNNKGNAAHGNQRFWTVVDLAHRGDPAARDALYGYLDPNQLDFDVCNEIAELDGIQGLDWIFERVGDFDTGEPWRFANLMEAAEKKDGKGAVALWLSQPRNAAVAALVDQKRTSEPKQAQAYVSFSEFKANPGRPSSAWGWARQATRLDRDLAAKDLLVSNDPEWLRTLARGIRHYPKILDVEGLLRRLRSADLGVPELFVEALNQVTDMRIRQEGLAFLNDDIVTAFNLLGKNAESGDEKVMLEALKSNTQSDPFDLHGISCDITEMSSLEKIDARELLLWNYEHTPCSECRDSVVRDLIKRGEAPLKMLSECLWDCAPDTREMAREALENLQ